MSKVRVRFAPSPTGHLHIGSVRAAIFNWLFARHNEGDFLVRIEDTDRVRSKQEYVDSILTSLEWLGLNSDEPLIYQSKRTDEYKKVINQLLEQGLAYPCFCKPEDAQEKVKKLEKGIATKYNGACRNKSYTQKDLEQPHAIRFKLPEHLKSISFEDKIRGTVTVELDQLDDFVIWRRDEMPTYNFCVVIDDIFMNITHVIRGEDHISNTPKQILIYQALKKDFPIFAHVPLILGASGGKLSKRDAAVSVIEYKKQGFLSDALFNYLVRLGWSHGDQEMFSKDEMIQYFSLDNVGKKGAIFDTKKLLWLNSVYIRNITFEEFLNAVKHLNNDKLEELTSAWNEGKLEQLFELHKERATTILQLVDDIILFALAPKNLDVSLIKKWVTAQTKILLEEFLKRSKEMEEYNHENLIKIAKLICDENATKLVALAQPLRLALTGKTASPGVFELLEILSLEEGNNRIRNLISQL